MPELPEVETVKRGLAPAMEGARITNVQLNRENLRFPFPDGFAKALTGCQVISMGRRAKYLLADLDNGNVLVMHLGMSGSFRVEMTNGTNKPGNFHNPRSEAEKHDHVIFELELPGQGARVIYNDPRRFGYMDLVKRSEFDTHRHFKSLGIEPTGNQLNGESLAKLLEGKTGTPEGRAAGPAADCRPWQHLCLRSALAGGPFSYTQILYHQPERRGGQRSFNTACRVYTGHHLGGY